MSSIDEVIQFDKMIINDERISIEQYGFAVEPHPISSHDQSNFGYQMIKKSILEVFPDVAVIPGMMMGSTDSRWFVHLSKNIFRFSPALITTGDLSRIHGNNERISIDNYVNLVKFYYHLIYSSDSDSIKHHNLKDEL